MFDLHAQNLTINVPAELFAQILNAINFQGNRIMAAIDNLETEVAEQTTVIESAVTLLTGLKTALDEAIASGSMARVQAVADTLDTNTNALAAAVAENTPVVPEPTPLP